MPRYRSNLSGFWPIRQLFSVLLESCFGLLCTSKRLTFFDIVMNCVVDSTQLGRNCFWHRNDNLAMSFFQNLPAALQFPWEAGKNNRVKNRYGNITGCE